jgi:hypothetical protein
VACTDLPTAGLAAPAAESGSTALPLGADKQCDAARAIAGARDFDMPFSIAGITERNYHGTGLLVDAARGLVVTDRNTVPVRAGRRASDLRRRAGSPGACVEFVHPLHNLAVILPVRPRS